MDGELPGQGKAAADCGRPPRQHLRDPRQEPRDERQRGGHHGLPARPVQGRSPGRAVRRSDPVDHRRPGPGLQAHGRPAGDRGGPRHGVRDLGRLRWRGWWQRRRAGAGGPRSGAARATAARTRSRTCAGGAPSALDEWIGSIKDTRRPTLNFKHLLLPHVPWQYLPDGRTYSPAGTDPIPQISRQTLQGPGPGRRAPAAPPAPGRLRGPRDPAADRPPEEGGPVGQVDGRADRRPRRRRSARASSTAARPTRRTWTRSRPCRCSSRRPARTRARSTARSWRPPTCCPTIAGRPQHRAAGGDRRQVGVLAGREATATSSRCSSATCRAGSACPSPSSSSARRSSCASGSPSSARATTAPSGSTGSVPTSS